MPGSALAEKTKFPSDNPAFTVELPSGWTSKVDKNGNLECHPPNDPAYNLTVFNMSRIENQTELRDALPKMLEGTGLKNLKLGEVEETASDTMQFLEAKGKGDSDGTQLAVVITGFEAQKGRFFALLRVGLAKDDKKHGKDYESIAASIEPLKTSAK